MEKPKEKNKEKESKERDKGPKGKKPVTTSQSVRNIHKRKPASKDFKGVIRLIGKDMDGHLKIPEAIMTVKGIGHTVANALTRVIERELSISPSTLVGDLTDVQMANIEEIAKNLQAHGVPVFLLNRRQDFDTGEDKHLLGVDLQFQHKQDIQRAKDARSWIGWRHALGQKVRGQHTRTTGRKGLTVGVVRKSIMKAAGVAAAKSDAKEKK